MRHIPGKRLIVSPLAVAEQTINEARELSGMQVKRVHAACDVDGDGTYIINYDRMRLVDHVKWDAVALDESSIIESLDAAIGEDGKINGIALLEDKKSNVEKQVFARLELSEIIEAISELPPALQEVAKMLWVEHRSIEETADLLCIRKEAVRTRMYRAIRRLTLLLPRW